MRSTAYMNHYPHYRGAQDREAVTFDGTASLSELTTLDTPMGRATDASLRMLGVDIVKEVPKSDMLLIGSQEQMFDPRRLKGLRQGIGNIAKWASEIEQSQPTPKWAIADRVDSVSESLRGATSQHELGFIGDVGGVLRQFGEECNDDGCYVDFGRRPGWYSAASDRAKAILALPSEAQNIIDLSPNKESKDSSELYHDSVLQMLDIDWLLAHRQELESDGFSDELREIYSSEQLINQEALQLTSKYVSNMTDKPLNKLHMAADIIRDLVNQHKSQIRYEKDTNNLMNQLFRPESQDNHD